MFNNQDDVSWERLQQLCVFLGLRVTAVASGAALLMLLQQQSAIIHLDTKSSGSNHVINVKTMRGANKRKWTRTHSLLWSDLNTDCFTYAQHPQKLDPFQVTCHPQVCSFPVCCSTIASHLAPCFSSSGHSDPRSPEYWSFMQLH